MTARHCARRSVTAATLRCRHSLHGGGATLEESDNERVIVERLEDAAQKEKRGTFVPADKPVSPLTATQ